MKSWKTTVSPAVAEAEDGRRLVRKTEDDEQYEEQADQLCARLRWCGASAGGDGPATAVERHRKA